MVDVVPFYPEAVRPDILVDIRQFYVETFRDKFFESPPDWFMFFLAMEVIYHLPLSIWAVGALIRGVITLAMDDFVRTNTL